MANSKKLTKVQTKKLFFLVILVSAIIFGSADLDSANSDDSAQSIYESGDLYLPTDDQMGAIDALFAKAKANGKLALIVMGANWCHDSRALAKNLYLPDIKEVVEENYELLFIDVGFYTNIRKVINRFGMPIIYSTPTTLIIDPISEKVINTHNLLTMRDAASVSPLETEEYFDKIVNNKERLSMAASMNIEHKKLSTLNQKIDQFEKQQAERIYKAFSVIGPMVKERKAGKDPKDFQKTWAAISKLRYTITDDLEKLRNQALEISQDENSKQELAFPEYPLFEWER